jgi:hypothetical protein
MKTLIFSIKTTIFKVAIILQHATILPYRLARALRAALRFILYPGWMR